jgi:phosphate transport system substrate-binding protein
MKKVFLVLILAAAFAVVSFADAVKVDPALPEYKPVSGISGSISSVGSDTLNNVMTYWAEGFKAMYPNVKIGIEGKGSSTAPPSLIAGTSQFGPMSRQMKPTEIDDFEKKFGYKPTEIKVAIDALAVYVNKDNPITGLTLTQADGLFSSTRKRGGKDITKWGQLGLTGEWADKPVSLYGRNSASGTYGYFKDTALSKGDYKPTVKEQPGSSAVVQGVSSDLGGVGYSGIGYRTSGVKAVPLGLSSNKIFEPDYQDALDGKYPLARFLYVYVNKKPNEPLGKLETEFLRFLLSKQGQGIVVKDGFYPLPAQVVNEMLKTVGAGL